MTQIAEKSNFIAYCLEEYKHSENLTGKAVIDLFTQFHVLEYITSCYGALHTTGAAYIVEDIKAFIAEQRGAWSSNKEL
jgi:hypothetical protein